MGSRVITAAVESRQLGATMAARWRYYRRILPAYLGAGRSQLTFWHETPEIGAGVENFTPGATRHLGAYYMSFREKAGYAGAFDDAGIPMLDYRGDIGPQYNPIAIAQWGLGNFNLFRQNAESEGLHRTLKAADWLVANLEHNAHGLRVWHHRFDWEYRSTLKAPWYSGLAQGQGISLLLRAHAQTGDTKYSQAAEEAFECLTRPVSEGGVLFEDHEGNLWIEEYLVDPPTHILNGFMWALWGVLDFWIAIAEPSAKEVFDRGVSTLLRNLARYDTGYWSLYEQSGTRLKMLASPFYHRLHVVQLRIMAALTGLREFAEFAHQWETYASRRANRARALIGKSAFKLVHY
ncbi:MAG TPA: D-glucuronyl C5-epimerase family protein [Terriglobales bacterium]|nr:D-glucuronyl C5-epimerase family protein [Terriglobales bacterium]